MSEEQPKITCQEKTKNPLRVEQGKRLAAISKAAKDKKMRERILTEQNLEKDVLKENGNNTTFLLVLGATIVVSAGIYYAYKSKRESPKVKEETAVIEEPKTRQNNMINYFD